MIQQIKKYQRIELLSWDESELKSGKIVKIKKFPGAIKVKLFRVTVSTEPDPDKKRKAL